MVKAYARVVAVGAVSMATLCPKTIVGVRSFSLGATSALQRASTVSGIWRDVSSGQQLSPGGTSNRNIGARKHNRLLAEDQTGSLRPFIPSALASAASNEEQQGGGGGSRTKRPKKKKKKKKKKSEESSSDSAGHRGYVSKAEDMGSLIDRLGLKKVEKDASEKPKKKNGRSAGKEDTGTDEIANDSSPSSSTAGRSDKSDSRKEKPKSAFEDMAWDSMLRAITIQQLVDIASKQKSTTAPGVIDYHEDVAPRCILDQTADTDLLSLQLQLDYAKNGHTVIPAFLSSDIIMPLRTKLVEYSASRTLDAYRQKVEVASGSAEVAVKCTTIEECINALHGLDVPADSLPFLQHFNVWKVVPAARRIAKSTRLADAAATLLDVPSVKLYQDSIFHKRPGDGPTPWHSDARMAPFDTSKMITFWVPLQPIPSHEDGGTGLIFADGSHSDFALPFWNGLDGHEYERLEERYTKISHHMPLEVGDVTVHAGWTLHCADDAVDERYAYAVTYVDAAAEVREDAATTVNGEIRGDDEDKWSYMDWVGEVNPRRLFRHPSVPVVWPKLLLPKDLGVDKGAVAALADLRSGKDLEGALHRLDCAGKEDAAVLTMTGLKGDSKKRSSQINQDRAVILSPYSVACPSESPFSGYGQKRLLVGIFDGHNAFGEAVAQFTCDELPNILADKLNEVQRRCSDLTTVQVLEETMVAVADSFVAVDSKGRVDLDPPSGGATATAVIQLGKYVFVANCGDSLSCIATYSKSTGVTEVIYTTKEDKAGLEEERQRIEEAGGSVRMPDEGSSDVPRVVGVDENGEMFGGIATTRSIGDWEFSEQLGITPEPNAVDGVDLTDITEGNDLQVFAVCFSDGVGDAMRIEDIAAVVGKGLFDDNGPHLLTALEDVLREAKAVWGKDTGKTYRDDMTIAASALSL